MNEIFKRTLVITPHYDDETIGCGGLMARLSREANTDLKVVAVSRIEPTRYLHDPDTVVYDSDREEEFYRALLSLGYGKESVIRPYHEYIEGQLDTYPLKQLVSDLDGIISTYQPTAVLFPYSSHHQDHQYVTRATIAALRPKVSSNYIRLKAMYEYPYITGWSDGVIPTSKIYVELSESDYNRKFTALGHYESQLNRDPRDLLDRGSIMSLASTRGHEVGLQYAEAFYPISVVIPSVL